MRSSDTNINNSVSHSIYCSFPLPRFYAICIQK